MKPAMVLLDPNLHCEDSLEFEDSLRKRVVGQEEAIKKITETMNKFMAGLQTPNRPVANLLFLGRTGTGKTLCAESVADILFGTDKACLKIDCSEFQQSHDISKLTGSPPGYVGHKDSTPFITQEKLTKYHSKDLKLSLVLFDEIEKAHASFRDLLLGITDKGVLHTGNGDEIDFTNTMFFMTSNIGSRETQDLLTPMGFGPSTINEKYEDVQLNTIVMSSLKKKFSAEFINRLDAIVVFKTLREDQLRIILNIELDYIQKRILSSTHHQKFVFTLDKLAEDFILKLGTDQKSGARELKRVLEKNVVSPMSSMILSSQITLGDVVQISMKNNSLSFTKIPCEIVNKLPENSLKAGA